MGCSLSVAPVFMFSFVLEVLGSNYARVIIIVSCL